MGWGDIGPSEGETVRVEFLRKLPRRGLKGVQPAISDAHEGIKAAVAKLTNASWPALPRPRDAQRAQSRRQERAQGRLRLHGHCFRSGHAD